MSGPVPMILGPFAFEGLGFGYEGVTRRLDTPWADIAIAGGFDAQQWTGPKSDDVTIAGVLFPEAFGGQSSLDGIAAAAVAGLPLMLVSGTAAAGVIAGLFTVQGVDEDRSFHDAAGQPRRNAYQIRLKRYHGALA